MNKLFLSVALVAIFSSAVTATHDPAWSDFRGSFLIGKNESFAPFPKTTSDPMITSENWIQQSTDCSNGGLFNGFQYIKGNDYSVGLLYDNNGIIAGIQMLIPKSVVLTPTNTLNYTAIPYYLSVTYNGEAYFILTAYLVDPSTICTGGRTFDALSTDGTGTGLWFQSGDSPASLLEVPQIRPEDTNQEVNIFTVNNCFPAMGFHNFVKVQQYEETNCTIMVPFFSLYNKNSKQLHGFGFITVGNITNPRFEQPPGPAIRLILGADHTPQCVLDLQLREGVTSLHVFFTDRPWTIGCSVFTTAVAYAKVLGTWLASFIADKIAG